MKQILILESDEAYGAEFASAIRARGAYEPVLAQTVREACLMAAQQPPDLAFIPLDDAENVIRSLHSLQPQLPVVVLLPEQDVQLPDNLSHLVQDTIVKTELHNALPDLLEDEHTELQSTALPDSEDYDVAADSVEKVLFVTQPADLLKQLAQRERVLAALISDQFGLQERAGTLDEQQLQEIHERVLETWRPGNSALLQFIRLHSRIDDLLLYTRPVRERRLLTVVAHPDLRLDQLRQFTSGAVQKLGGRKQGSAKQKIESAPEAVEDEVLDAEPSQNSYALVWSPLHPLPGMLQVALRRSLERIAESNGYELRHLLVDAQLVHIVVTVPQHLSSAALVHTFKQGAETEIRQQFGVDPQLWAKGYYATEGDEPLSEAELSVFLGSTTPT